MSGNKKVFILGITILASIVAIWYMYLDFSLLFGLRESTFPSSIIKRFDVAFTAIIVAIVGKDSLGKKDSLLMKLTFIAICCAEIFFLLGNTFGGIGFFLTCQVLLIIRNGQGLKQKLFSVKDRLAGLKLIISGAAIFALFGVIVAFVFFPILKFSVFLYVLIIYGLAVSISFWVGLANYILALFPKKNSLMVGVAMTCFFFSDILVGMIMIINSGPVFLISNSLVWVLYTPAIMLLAYSCYKYGEPA